MKTAILRILFFNILVYSVTAQTTTSNLLFKSSFDNNVIVDKTVVWNHHLKGTDVVSGYTFPNDLPGNNSEHFFNYVVGDMDNYSDYANAEIDSTVGYDGNTTNALYIEFIEDDPNFVSYSRVQYVMFGDDASDDPIQRMNQGYVKYKIKTHIDHNDVISDWRLPIEWKDMDDDGFRMGLYIYDTDTATPFWVVKGQYMIDGELGDDVWEFENYEIPVVEDDWFELEVYWFGHPDSNLGKLKVAINGQILFNVTAQTKNPEKPDKMFYFMPFKVYGTVGYSWITDFEYWDLPPLDSVLYESQLALVKDIEHAKVSLYPNPITDILNIQANTKISQIEIYSIHGQLITTVKQGVNTNQLNMSGLKKGVYIIKLTDLKGNFFCEKFIKK